MKEVYTINYDVDYVFLDRADAEETKSDLLSRFPDEVFEIYTIDEHNEDFQLFYENAE